MSDKALAEAAEILNRAGIDNPRREARLLDELAAGDPVRLKSFVVRRAAGEPYSRIRGLREFWSLDFALSPDTLDPRPDSETLIDAALAALPDKQAPLSVIDFGTGTGALLLAFLSEYPNATGIGLDILPGAIAMAERNAVSLGLAARARFIAGDWRAINLPPADVILANPPYIPDREIDTLDRAVRVFDPRAALDGGLDGLDAYRSLAPAIARNLKPEGFAFVELGAGQADAVAAICRAVGLNIAGTRLDLGGIVRCLAIR
ncbi:MAG TPA: peptide chain release factor N(5)-glutamine methyltransferase, partial [Stellaceae bacterium]|nr:peptide chain release factor N(5)-glutamine methyltransferase [Stellaceae bacterium]